MYYLSACNKTVQNVLFVFSHCVSRIPILSWMIFYEHFTELRLSPNLTFFMHFLTKIMPHNRLALPGSAAGALN